LKPTFKKIQPQAKRWAKFELTWNFNPKAKNQYWQ
jgi:hypothetical protein